MLLAKDEADRLRYGLTIARTLIHCRSTDVRSRVEKIVEIFKKYKSQLSLFGLDLNFDGPLVSNARGMIDPKVEKFLEELGNFETSIEEEEEEEEEEAEVGSELENKDCPPSSWTRLVDDLQSLYTDGSLSNVCTLSEAFRIADLFASYVEDKYFDEMGRECKSYWKRNLERLRFIKSALAGSNLSDFDKFCLLKAAKLTMDWNGKEDDDWLKKITDKVCWVDIEAALSGLVTKFVEALNGYLSNFSKEHIEWEPSAQNVLNLFDATLPNLAINEFVHSERILIWYLSKCGHRALPTQLFSLLDMCEHCDPAVVEYARSTGRQVKVYSAKRYGEAPENGKAEIVQKARIDLDAIANAE